MAKSSRFSISGTISMIDKVTGTMKKATRSVTGFSRKMRNQFRMASFSAKRLNKNINKIGGRAATRGLQGLAIGIALVAREYVRFDDAIFGATARFKAAEKPGTDMTKVMERLRVAARKTGAETQFTAAQAADGLNKFALAGFNSEEAIKSLRSQVDLATVTGEDFMQVADQSTDLLGSFGGNALESAAKVEKLKQMNSLLAVATLSANVTLNDLFETLKQAAPIGTKAGIAMKDIIATASVLGSAGIKGSMAATTMKNMFARLAGPSAEVRKGFKMLNLEQADFINDAGKLKNTTKIFEALSEKTKGMTDVKALEVFKNLFGLRGMAGAAVLEKNIGALREQLIKMGKDPQKVMQQTADFMRQSLGNRLKTLTSAATELGFKFFEAFAGDGKKGIDSLTKSIREINVKPIVATLKVFFSIIGAIFTVLNPFIPLIAAIIIGIKVWAFWQAILASSLYVTILPFILIAVAITALIFLIVDLVKNWDEMKETFKDNAFFVGLLIILDFIDAKIKRITASFSALGALISGDFEAMQVAALKLVPTLSEEDRIKAEAQITGKPFASPESKKIADGNQTTTTNGRVDINVAAPSGTTTEQSGQLPAGMQLNTGAEL